MEITPTFGSDGVSPMVATMLPASAASCAAVNSTSRGAPVEPEVTLTWAMPPGRLLSPGTSATPDSSGPRPATGYLARALDGAVAESKKITIRSRIFISDIF